MPEFRYRLPSGGEGRIEAADAGMAVRRLAWSGHFPASIEAVGGTQVPVAEAGARPGRLRGSDVSDLTRQLATFLAAGFPLARALGFAAGASTRPALRVVVAQITAEVSAGGTLADALAKHPAFDQAYLSMVRAGEESGQLAAMFERLREMRDSAETLRSEVVGAMAYPGIMILAMVGAVTLMMTTVIPRFAGMFADLGTALPLPTLILLGISQFLAAWWWALGLAGLGLGYGARQYGRTPAGCRRFENLRDHVPVVGSLVREAAQARFARTLALLLKGGVALVPALGCVRALGGSLERSAALDRCLAEVTSGRPFAESLAATKTFDPTLVEMIRLGEESGDIAGMLLRAAERSERTVSVILRTLTKVIEPVMILFMGLVVGGIVAAMLLPIVEMNMAGGA